MQVVTKIGHTLYAHLNNLHEEKVEIQLKEVTVLVDRLNRLTPLCVK